MKNPTLTRAERSRTVTAVLGPTNTGKTHLAIDRMLAHRTGVIGLPLRLLAREVYGRIVARIGADEVALITGEEKILPAAPRYYVATVEAMPLDLEVEFVAIDEVQLGADLERGRVFTDRILRVRGRYETLLLGALTARPLLERLLPGLNVVTRPRMSVLTYGGEKKITRLPPRSAVVAFSANEVYAIAELIRRQCGGAAIVMGALSPRTRNAQVDLFQSGDVDFLIATDAIGMGLNLDVDHVAFASARKFDGYQYRALSAAELGQIAGRAGRHTRDGTFGVTAKVGPFPDELVQALETHAFQSAKVFQWRNAELNFASIADLRASLDEPAQEEGLTKAPPADDQKALEYAAKSPDVSDVADSRARVALLWDVCQVPDYRKIAPANHADLLLTLYGFLVNEGKIPDDWMARQVRYADRTDGDIDTLSNRIAHIRTWTFVANRNDWLADPAEWRQTTRNVEDRLSDALHERLMQRFVDRRTSVLMKRLRENAMLESEVNADGDVMVEGQHVGVLHGFRFQPDATAGDQRDQKALRSAAAKALSREMERRADKASAAPDAQFALGSDASIRWQGALIGKVVATDDTLKPTALLLADDTLPPAAKEKVQARLSKWLSAHVEGLLKPLFDLRAAEGLDGGARGLAYRLSEALGSVERGAVAAEAKALEQGARAGLRALGVRFGAYHIFVPALLKPAPSQLLALLWALRHADLEVKGLTEVPQLSSSGRTSIPVDTEILADLYGVVGFRVCGPRAVRIDILERLADQIRPLVAWRPGPEAGDPPPGAVPQGGAFLVTVTMTSLLGCSGEDFAAVLKSLGYRVDRREADEAEKVALSAAQQVRRAGRKKGKDALPQPAGAGVRTVSSVGGGAGAEEAPADGSAGEAPAANAEAASDEPTADVTPVEPPENAPAEATDAAPAEPAADAATAEPADPLLGADAPQEGGSSDPAPAGGPPAETAGSDEDGGTAMAEPVVDGAAEGPASAEAGADADAQAPASDAAAAEPGVDGTPEAAAAGEAGVDGDAHAPASDAAMAEPGVDGTAEAAASGEAGGDGDVEAPAPDAAADAGPVIIEIWRVPRYQRPGTQERRRRPQPAGEGDGEARRRPRRRREADQAPAAKVAEEAPTTQKPPKGKGKKQRRREDRREGERPARPPRPERQADPDSPFAKLAALKQELEKGSGDR
ncbi:MAG: helicase-related protein [Pseudomonadota bacterium]